MDYKLIKKYLDKQKIKAVEKFDFEKKQVKYSEEIEGLQIQKFSGDEEIVRAYLLAKLVNELGYSNLKRIELEKSYTIKGGHGKLTPRIDVIVKDSNGNPFLFIEVKAPDKYESDKMDIEGQLFELADREEKSFKTKVSHLVYYTIDLTDTEISDNFILIDRSLIRNYNDWESKGSLSYANSLPKNYGKPTKKLLTNKDLKILDKTSLSRVRTNIHNTLWSAGVEDNEAYLFLVKYLLTKIYDEQNSKPKSILICQIYDTDFQDHKRLFDRINEKYFEALRKKLNYDNQDLEATGKILSQENIPLKSLYFLVQELEKFSFSKSLKEQNEDILGNFFEETNREKFKQSKGQFFTHTNIAKFLIYGLQLDKLAYKLFESERRLPYVIDPSAGSGTFLIELMKLITYIFNSQDDSDFTDNERNTFDRLFPKTRPHSWAETYLYGIDNSNSLSISSKVNMILHGDGSSTIIKNDGIVNFQAYKNLNDSILTKYGKSDPNIYGKETENFLVTENFDAVISNPPFSVNPIEDEKERAKHFLFGDKKNSENLFIERWYQLLKSNGRLGVVLPESAFDTTENKYIRLFIYKYFNVKSVVSLPQLTFEPYTSTKTSLLFAQKKSKVEIKKWNELWKKYSNEWAKLARRVKNYQKILAGENEQRFISINKDLRTLIENAKNDKKEYEKIIFILIEILKRNKDEKDYEGIDENKLSKLPQKRIFEIFESEIKEYQMLENTKRLLKDYISNEDNEVSLKELIENYKDEINELCKYDNDTKEVFGFVNTWWVFGEIAKDLNYKIFMAEVENIGYKRTIRGEKPMPNELFDLEIAPSFFNFDIFSKSMDDYIDEVQMSINNLEQNKSELESKLKEKEGKSVKPSRREFSVEELKLKILDTEDQIYKLKKIQNERLLEKQDLTNQLKSFYNNQWKLKDEDRVAQSSLSRLFSNNHLIRFRSDNVVLRTKNKLAALDYLRDIQWA